MDLAQRLLATFEVEHADHLRAIREALDRAAVAADGPTQRDLEEIFRRVHSTKGAARVVGLKPIESLAHRLEDLCQALVQGDRRLDDATIASIRRALDASEDWMRARSTGIAAPPTNHIEGVLGDLGAPPGEPVAARAERTSPGPVGDLPAPTAATLRLPVTQIERLLRSAASLAAASSAQDFVARAYDEVERRLESSPSAIARSRVAEELAVLRRAHQRAASRLRELSGRLDHDLRRARTVRAAEVLAGLGAMCRELARDRGLELDVAFEGLELEADREILEGLREVTLHLLRNAVTHGLETPAERRLQGKPERGSVRVGLAASRDQLVLTVHDDGRGLDPERIAARARELGLHGAGPLDRPTAFALVQQATFSTAAGLDELAGRGMGLAVVASHAARLGGAFDIDSQPGKGAQFQLTLPIEVTHSAILVVDCAAGRFGLPSSAVEELVRVTDNGPTGGPREATWDGRPLDLVPLASLLGRPGEPVLVNAGHLLAVVLRSPAADRNAPRLALAVDAVADHVELLVRDLGAVANQAPLALGAALLPSGQVCAVLDPEALARARARAGEEATSLRTQPTAEIAAVPTILIADDSMTTRALQQHVLESHGYRVVIADDGVEALHRLRSETIDAVVADLQMPRLDGLGLLAAIKQDPTLARLPVVLLTSVDGASERQRGRELGAAAYLVKSSFDQTTLVDTLEGLL